jgi:hypothetical protein
MQDLTPISRGLWRLQHRRLKHRLSGFLSSQPPFQGVDRDHRGEIVRRRGLIPRVPNGTNPHKRLPGVDPKRHFLQPRQQVANRTRREGRVGRMCCRIRQRADTAPPVSGFGPGQLSLPMSLAMRESGSPPRAGRSSPTARPCAPICVTGSTSPAFLPGCNMRRRSAHCYWPGVQGLPARPPGSAGRTGRGARGVGGAADTT